MTFREGAFWPLAEANDTNAIPIARARRLGSDRQFISTYLRPDCNRHTSRVSLLILNGNRELNSVVACRNDCTTHSDYIRRLRSSINKLSSGFQEFLMFWCYDPPLLIRLEEVTN